MAWYGGFPHLPYGMKPRGARMGKGKGSAKHWYYLARPGSCILHLRHANAFKLRYNLVQLKRCLPGAVYMVLGISRNEAVFF